MSNSELQSLGSLGSKAKQIDANVAKYILQESKKETSPASYIRRTVEATGVSRTTVFKIRRGSRWKDIKLMKKEIMEIKKETSMQNIQQNKVNYMEKKTD